MYFNIGSMRFLFATLFVLLSSKNFALEGEILYHSEYGINNQTITKIELNTEKNKCIQVSYKLKASREVPGSRSTTEKQMSACSSFLMGKKILEIMGRTMCDTQKKEINFSQTTRISTESSEVVEVGFDCRCLVKTQVHRGLSGFFKNSWEKTTEAPIKACLNLYPTEYRDKIISETNVISESLKAAEMSPSPTENSLHQPTKND